MMSWHSLQSEPPEERLNWRDANCGCWTQISYPCHRACCLSYHVCRWVRRWRQQPPPQQQQRPQHQSRSPQLRPTQLLEQVLAARRRQMAPSSKAAAPEHVLELKSPRTVLQTLEAGGRAADAARSQAI